MTILIGKSEGGLPPLLNLEGLQDKEFPIYSESLGKLNGSGVLLNASGDLDIGVKSLNFGQAYQLGSGYENFFLCKTFNGKSMHPVWQDGSILGDPTPSMRLYTSELLTRFIIPENADDKTGVITNPTYINGTGANTRIFAIYLEVVQDIRDVFVLLTDTNTGSVVYKEYLGDFTSNVERRVELKTPVDAFTTSDSTISFMSTSGDLLLKADATGTYPWLAFDFKTWEDKKLGSEKQSFLVTTNNTIPVSSDPNIPTFWGGLTDGGISAGLTLDAVTGSMINTSGKTLLSLTGTLSMQPVKGGGGGVQSLYLWSETSSDGISWVVNPESLRVYEISDDGKSFTTSISFYKNWLDGEYLRFSMYATGTGSGFLELVPPSTTVVGQLVTGFSAVWGLKED